MTSIPRTLHDITRARELYREVVTDVLKHKGVEPPKTERDWVLFNVNQRLRLYGVGKPLPPDLAELDPTGDLDPFGESESVALEDTTS